MSQRLLLTMGVVGIAAAVVVGGFGMSTTALGFSMVDRFSGSNGTTISMDQAQQSVRSFIDRTGNKDLQIDELMQFDHNFYGLVKERSTGIGAFEVLVNKHSGSVSFEPGPDMMWNTKYSIMGRMGITGGAWMGGFGTGGSGMGGPATGGPGMSGEGTGGVGTTDSGMTVTGDRATQIAQSWLDRQGGGSSAGMADTFHGYYTLHFQRAGQIAGMLSVNGSSGQVWFHSWHGRFIQSRDLGA